MMLAVEDCIQLQFLIGHLSHLSSKWSNMCLLKNFCFHVDINWMNLLGLWIVGQTIEVIWRCHCGLRKHVMDLFYGLPDFIYLTIDIWIDYVDRQLCILFYFIFLNKPLFTHCIEWSFYLLKQLELHSWILKTMSKLYSLNQTHSCMNMVAHMRKTKTKKNKKQTQK